MLTAMADAGDSAKRVKTLKMSRRGKKISITTRVKEIEKLVAERGGRRRIQYLAERLGEVFESLRQVCRDISNLCHEVDEYNDLEDVELQVDSCIALVNDYLHLRRDDPSSSGSSFCSAWVRQHASGMLGGNSRDGSVTASHSSADDVSIVRVRLCMFVPCVLLA